MANPLEQKIISNVPPFALIGSDLDDFGRAQIDGFRIGRDAIVEVNPHALEERPATLELSPKTLTIAKLATLCTPQRVIDKGFESGVKNISEHVRLALDAFETPHRSATALTRTMWDIGFYTVAKSAEPLGLDEQEADVVDRLSQGHQMKAVDEQLEPKYGEAHLKSRAVVTRIGRRTNWQLVDALIWRSIVGGDITTHAPATPSGW